MRRFVLSLLAVAFTASAYTLPGPDAGLALLAGLTSVGLCIV